MFERYTVEARRVIFFARYEASQFGSPYIETEHLLLGLLREDKALTNRFLRSHASVDSIRKQIESHTTIREKVSTSVELSLSNECKRVLAYAAEEAERLGHEHLGTEHLLLGLLREEKCFASEILRERGLKLAQIRDELARSPQDKPAARKRPSENSLLAKFSRDLTQAAMEGRLEPLVGREKETEAVMEVLCSAINRNPLLICERGAASGDLAELLAQLIADGEAPSFLLDKRILALDLQEIAGGAAEGKTPAEILATVVAELIEDAASIAFIDEIQELAQLDPSGIFRKALLNGEIQCIGASAAAEFDRSTKVMPWLGRCFRKIRVPPMSEGDIIRSLLARKDLLEKFHAVSYTDEAIESAVRYSARYFPGDVLFDKAMEVLDTAGARVKLRKTSLPEEVTQAQKRIKFIMRRMDLAIANQEFEEARFYADEERKQREELRALRDKYKLDDLAAGIVVREIIEDVVSRWTGIPVTSIDSGQAHEDGSGSAPLGRTGPFEGLPRGSNLRVFMCHASDDKSAVRELYERLNRAPIEPWFDAENLLAGQEWRYEIEKAVRSTHIVLVCLSTHSVSKSGFVNKEIRIALDVADQQPEGTIFVIPLKLEECEVPDRLRQWQWVNLYEEKGFERLMRALLQRGREIGVHPEQGNPPPPAKSRQDG
jgi:ATP-dependent Clp protease ATP-binding subunit ClpC